MRTFNSSHFRHSPTSHVDERMLKLFAKHGHKGWGVFWHAIELLYLNEGSLDANALRTQCEQSADAFDYCVMIELLKKDGDNLYSDRLNEELEYRWEKSRKAKKSVQKRWLNKGQKPLNTNVQRTNNERNTNVILVEESRVEQSRREKRRPSGDTAPTKISSSLSKDTVVTTEIMVGFAELVHAASEALGNRKMQTHEAELQYKKRLKTFTHAQILEAFRNVPREPDQWQLKNNGQRPLAWWLKNDERVEGMLSCHLKAPKNRTIFTPAIP